MLQHALQHAMQRTLQNTLQHALQHALQRTLRHTLQYALQHTLPHTLQHMLQRDLRYLLFLFFTDSQESWVATTFGGVDGTLSAGLYGNSEKARFRRVKPDLVAPGVNIVSARSDGDSFSGT